MKKLLAFLAFSLLASQAFAGNTVSMVADLTSTSAVTGATLYGDTATTATTSSVLIGKTSTGVALAGNTASNGYALATQHKSGNRAFGTAYDSTSVYYKDVTAVGTAVKQTISTTDSTEFTGAGWTSM
ncbi:MAG TPA: hypothetical protein VJ550_05845 [Geomonas sp.]|nr:hypothetical protein [Geomonas sp.]